MKMQTLCAELGEPSLPKLWPGMEGRLWAGAYLVVPPPNVQNVPLRDRPVEGQAWHSITKGERVLAVGDSSDVNRHLWGKYQASDQQSPTARSTSGSPGHCPICLSMPRDVRDSFVQHELSRLPSPEMGAA